MLNLTKLLLVLLSLGGASQAAAQLDSSAAPHPATPTKVFVITLAGDVEPGMASFLARALRDAMQNPDAVVIIQMDTFGGRVDAALEIVDTILNAQVKRKVAYIKTKAISAGALIALSCDELVMKKGTTIGDCAPISVSQEGPTRLDEKFQSPLRAKFRALAKRNGFPQALAESMVSSDMAILRVVFADSVAYMDSISYAEMPAAARQAVLRVQTVVAKGKLLTMNDDEALQLGFSRFSVDGVDDMIKQLGITSYELVPIEQSWSEDMVRFLTTIAPLLMMLGFGLLYMEFKTPGFGIFGIAGVLILALVFFGQYMVGLANYTELLLILLGVALVMVEVFVFPGTFIAAVAGVVCIAAGLLLSMQDFTIPQPEAPWQMQLLTTNLLKVAGSLLAGGVISFLSIALLLPKLGMVVKGPYLSETLADSHADSDEVGSVAVGDIGEALTLLRPTGKARIGGMLHDVVSEGDFVEKGSAIVVRQVLPSKIIVARKTDA